MAKILKKLRWPNRYETSYLHAFYHLLMKWYEHEFFQYDFAADFFEDELNESSKPSYIVTNISTTFGKGISRTRQSIISTTSKKCRFIEVRTIGEQATKHIYTEIPGKEPIEKTQRSNISKDELKDFLLKWDKLEKKLPDDLYGIKTEKKLSNYEENQPIKPTNCGTGERKEHNTAPEPNSKTDNIQETDKEIKDQKPMCIRGALVSTEEENLFALALCNKAREKVGKPPLTWDDELARYAQDHSIDQYLSKNCGHFGFDERSKKVTEKFVSLGENVGYNCSCRKPITKIHVGLMQSVHHRANIEGNFDTVGIGFAHGTDGEWYETQLFGLLRSQGEGDDATITHLTRAQKIEVFNAINDQISTENDKVGFDKKLSKWLQDVTDKEASTGTKDESISLDSIFKVDPRITKINGASGSFSADGQDLASDIIAKIESGFIELPSAHFDNIAFAFSLCHGVMTFRYYYLLM